MVVVGRVVAGTVVVALVIVVVAGVLVVVVLVLVVVVYIVFTLPGLPPLAVLVFQLGSRGSSLSKLFPSPSAPQPGWYATSSIICELFSILSVSPVFERPFPMALSSTVRRTVESFTVNVVYTSVTLSVITAYPPAGITVVPFPSLLFPSNVSEYPESVIIHPLTFTLSLRGLYNSSHSFLLSEPCPEEGLYMTSFITNPVSLNVSYPCPVYTVKCGT